MTALTTPRSSARPSIQCSRLATCLLLFLLGCGDRAADVDAKHPKVVLVGIDGAAWPVMRPLIEAGRLPTLERLIESGSSGVLRATEPLISPPIWTTIATGKNRSVHGIEEFFYAAPTEEEPKRELLVDTTQREVSALWNWMGPLRRTVGFAGWWASWPAESVNGWILSDRFARSQWSVWPGGIQQARVTHPAGLATRFADLESDAAERWVGEIRELAQFTNGEWQHLTELKRPVPYDALSDLKFGYLSQRAYEEAFLELIDAEQPDLSAVFLIANDPISHSYWHALEPEAFVGLGEEIDADQVKRFAEVIPNFWEHLDRFLARLLESISLEETAVVLVSDHGFKATGELRPSGNHTPDGVIVLSGRGVQSGQQLAASILDVAPTVLRLLELPIAEDLEGRPIEAAIGPEVRRRDSVPTFDHLFEPVPPLDQLGPGDEEMRKQLESLGYLDG